MDDVAAIKNLLFRYAELLNTGQFDAVGQLFEHGCVRVAGNPRTYVGAEEVAEMYRSTTNVPKEGPDSLLYTTNVQVVVDGDAAEAKSYFIAFHQRDGHIAPVVGGRYRDTLERRDGGWAFTERSMNVDLVGDLGSHLQGALDDYLPGRSSAAP
jgi:ketosteroid isomerase-like protein